MSLNLLVISGRLVADPEMQTSKDGKTEYVKFTLAVPRNYGKKDERKTDFVRCIAYSNAAKFLTRFCRKGEGLNIAGRIQNTVYEGSDGKKHTITECVAERIDAHLNSPYDGPVAVQKTEGSIHPDGAGKEETFTDDDFFDFPY